MKSDTLTCSKCELVKPISDFYVKRRLKRGYDYYCKSCENTIQMKSNTNKREKELLHRFAVYSHKLVCRTYGTTLGTSLRAKRHFIKNHLTQKT